MWMIGEDRQLPKVQVSGISKKNGLKPDIVEHWVT